VVVGIPDADAHHDHEFAAEHNHGEDA